MIFSPLLPLGLDDSMFLEHGGLGRCQDAIEATEDGERKDDFAILISLVRPAEQVADAPDETGDLGMSFGGH